MQNSNVAVVDPFGAEMSVRFARTAELVAGGGETIGLHCVCPRSAGVWSSLGSVPIEELLLRSVGALVVKVVPLAVAAWFCWRMWTSAYRVAFCFTIATEWGRAIVGIVLPRGAVRRQVSSVTTRVASLKFLAFVRCVARFTTTCAVRRFLMG